MSERSMLTQRVRQHLVDAGHVTLDGLGRKAQLRTCGRCQGITIVGLDSHRCAIRAVCDPTEIDRVGELLALAAGRRTFELWGRELEARDRWRIAGPTRKPIIAEHQCGADIEPSENIIALFIPTTNRATGKAPF